MELLGIFRLALKGETQATLDQLKPYLDANEISYTKLEAHIIQSFILNRIGLFNEAVKSLSIFGKFFKHIEQSYHRGKSLSMREKELFALILLVKAFRNIKLGFLDEAEIQLEHSCELIPAVEDEWQKCAFEGIYFNELGLLYWKMGKYDLSIEAHEESITILSKPIEELLGVAYNDQAISYYEMGHYLRSLELLNKAVELLKNNNSIQDYGYGLGNLGRVYRAMGDIVKAKKFALQSLEIKEQVGNKLDLAVEYRNLGVLEMHSGNYSDSKRYFLESLKLREIISNPIELSESYYYLILLGLEWNKPEEISESQISTYYTKLEKLFTESDKKLINDRLQLTKALLLQNSGSDNNIEQSYTIMKSLIEDKFIQNDVKITCLIILCHSLIEQLKVEPNLIKLVELQSFMDTLTNHAKTNHLYGLLIEVLILKSRFWFLEEKIAEAKASLALADEICDQKSLIYLKKRVAQEFTKYDGIIYSLSKLTKDKGSVCQSIEILELENYLKSMSLGANLT